MKKLPILAASAALALFLAGCGSVVSDFDTPKSEDLSKQYDYYRDSQSSLASGMGITPEQSDEAFIVLVSCGLDSKVTDVSRKMGDDGHCTVLSGASTFDVYYTDGVIDRVERGGKEVYPTTETPEPDSSSDSAADSGEATLEEAVESAIEDANAENDNVTIVTNFGSESPDDCGVEIYLKGKDNLSTNLIRSGMWVQANDILKELQSRSEIAQVCIFWSFPLIDSYGNSKDENVMKILIKRETLQNINFDNFDWNKFPEIADDYYEHAALSAK